MTDSLTDEEMEMLIQVGLRRYDDCRKQNIYDDLQFDATPEEKKANDIWSCAAEYFFAKLSGLPWTGMPSSTTNAADVGSNIEVKSTKYFHKCHLIVRSNWRKKDPFEYIRNHIYVLIPYNKIERKFRYAGYMHGTDVMQDKYINSKEGNRITWWVPEDVLIKELPNVDRAAAE